MPGLTARARLGYLNGSGKYDERTVTLSIEWRKVGTSAWTAYEYKRTAGTGDELAETITFTFDAGAYECRIKNKSDKVDDAAQVDTVKWTGLKSCIAQPTSYAGMTTILCRFSDCYFLGAQTPGGKRHRFSYNGRCGARCAVHTQQQQIRGNHRSHLPGGA